MVIVFDSDAAENDDVAWAAHHLAEVLRPRGALVEQVFLPAAGSGKVGLDDFLKIEGHAGWCRVRGGATPVPVPDQPDVLSNVILYPDESGRNPEGRHPDHIRRRLARLTRGWPKRVGPRLFAEGGDARPVWIESPAGLVAWAEAELGRTSGSPASRVAWQDRVRGARSRAEFLEYLQRTAPAFKGLELFPHHQPAPDRYYMHPAPGGGDGAALGELIGYLTPATEHDRQLILAFLATLFWAGPPGQRPAFVFEADDPTGAKGRGAGKSMVTILAQLLLEERVVQTEGGEDFERLKSRLLSSSASAPGWWCSTTSRACGSARPPSKG